MEIKEIAGHSPFPSPGTGFHGLRNVNATGCLRAAPVRSFRGPEVVATLSRAVAPRRAARMAWLKSVPNATGNPCAFRWAEKHCRYKTKRSSLRRLTID